jgi:hypothetical protein
MTREQVKIALNEGIPFAVNMADGRQYTVTNRDQVPLGPTRIVVVDEKGLAHVLPLLTVTGISYLATGPQ